MYNCYANWYKLTSQFLSDLYPILVLLSHTKRSCFFVVVACFQLSAQMPSKRIGLIALLFCLKEIFNAQLAMCFNIFIYDKRPSLRYFIFLFNICLNMYFPFEYTVLFAACVLFKSREVNLS